MKAVILAGGNGTRLHPISLATPKPMVKLLDRPVLEHILALLRAAGFADICLTLRYLPQTVTDYFGDGSGFGVHLDYRIEDAPLGTAGSVAACRDFVGEEDVLVISGDAACGVDLQGLCRAHYENMADVSMLLKKSASPLEFGLVLTSADNRIRGFIEKPSRDRVYTDLVNTGIYILSNRTLREIPTGGFCDFARDLFPAMLARGARLYGFEAEGYWCDIGNRRSYLKANFDALGGALLLELRPPAVRPGLYSESPLPEGVTFRPPCCIGRGVTLEAGARIGPYAVIGSGSTVRAGASVRSSVVDAACIGERARLSGSIVCAGASVGADARLLEGSVIGADCRVGRGACVESGVCLWPGKHLGDGQRASRSIISGGEADAPRFGEGGTLRGEATAEITPEFCLSLGMRIPEGPVCVSSCGTYPRLLASCFANGAAARGHLVLETDSATAATAANTARRAASALSAFFDEQDGEICIRFFDKNGLPPARETERTLESGNGERQAGGARSGRVTPLTGCEALHRADALRFAFPPQERAKLRVCVEGRGAAASLLRESLCACGIDATSERALPALGVSRDGFSLSIRDEENILHGHEQLLAALALVEREHGGGTLVLPYQAPDAAEVPGVRTLRLGRDEEAAARFAEAPLTADALFLALRLLTALPWYGTLSALFSRVPRYYESSREIRLDDRGFVLRRLATAGEYRDKEFVSGLKLRMAGGSVCITPVGQSLLRVRAECGSEEYAEELCAAFEQKINRLAAAQQAGQSE